jgi:hypothetical protein
MLQAMVGCQDRRSVENLDVIAARARHHAAALYAGRAHVGRVNERVGGGFS